MLAFVRLRLFWLAIFTLVLCSAKAEQRFVYLSAGGAVTAYSVDSENGKLTEIQQVKGAGLTAITRDQKILYRVSGKEVATYRIKPDGKLRELGVNKWEGRAGYLSLDATDRYLAASNYGGGSVTVWGIGEKRIAKGEPVATMALEKAAHSSVFSPDNRFLLVPATTPNKIFQLKFDAKTGALTKNDPPSASGPTGEGEAQQPRHLVFHPNNSKIAYTTLERTLPGVGVWRWDADKGTLEVIQNIPTIPDGFTGSITTADLHLTPDAKFLYVSNRDLTDRKAVTGDSSIVGFKVDAETGKLTLIGHTPAPQVPRGFAIDQAGEFLYAAGQTAAKLAIYRIDKATGALTEIERIGTGKGPNWVRCVTLP